MILPPTITSTAERKFIGKSLSMSMMNNRIGELWGGFAPQIKHIPNRIGSDKFSLQVYPSNYFKAFNPQAEFVKWALVEVENFDNVPEGLECFTLAKGQYAVFHYKGSSQEASSLFQRIYGEWLPQSPYQLDDRPHFEVLGALYKNNDPNSEEDIWIPIRE